MSEVTEEEIETISHGSRTENDSNLLRVKVVLKMGVTVQTLPQSYFSKQQNW